VFQTGPIKASLASPGNTTLKVYVVWCTVGTPNNSWPSEKSRGDSIIQSQTSNHTTWPVFNQSQNSWKFRRGSTIVWCTVELYIFSPEFPHNNSQIATQCWQGTLQSYRWLTDTPEETSQCSDESTPSWIAVCNRCV
jgi:hypothetical protein